MTDDQTYFPFFLFGGKDLTEWKIGVRQSWQLFGHISDVKYTEYPAFFVKRHGETEESPIIAFWKFFFNDRNDMVRFVERNKKDIVVYYVNGDTLRAAILVPVQNLMEKGIKYTIQ